MHWFRKAAEKGHPDASYNIVSAHMQGYNVNLNDHEIEKYLKAAHESGNEEATRALKDMMPHKYWGGGYMVGGLYTLFKGNSIFYLSLGVA